MLRLRADWCEHTVIFGGFSARCDTRPHNDAQCKAVVTADGGIGAALRSAEKSSTKPR